MADCTNQIHFTEMQNRKCSWCKKTYAITHHWEATTDTCMWFHDNCFKLWSVTKKTAARERLVRSLNIGNKGEKLADEILAQYIKEAGLHYFGAENHDYCICGCYATYRKAHDYYDY